MKGFEHDEFSMYQIDTNDFRPGNPSPTSHQSSLTQHSTSNVIAASTITNIMDGVIDDQFFLDLNIGNGAVAEKNLSLDENSFINLPNNSTSLVPYSSATNSDPVSSLAANGEMDSVEVPEFSPDLLLGYISEILMEENMDEKYDVYPEHPALLAAEKPFYEILSDVSSSLSPDQNSSNDSDSPYRNVNADGSNGILANNSWPYDPLEYRQLQTNPVSVDYSSESSALFSNGVSNVNGMLQENPSDSLYVLDTPASQFQKGLEEARKFLPSDDKLMIGGFRLPQEPIEERKPIEISAENENADNGIHGSRGTKTQHNDGLELQEGRSTKQRALVTVESVPTDIFDEVMLCSRRKSAKNDEEKVRPQAGVRVAHGSKSKGTGGGKGRGRSQPRKEVVDITTLLIHCAQAVATNDRRSANELLKQIKQHSSPYGDGNERLAHCFAEGLEARLAGTGSEIYHSIMAKPITAADMLKAYQGYMCACPFKKVSYFFSNRTILNLAKNATRLHIIDFGIYHGFQWPCFLHRLAIRPEGPPRLRITGIDVPRPGFRPTERVDETGRRLAEYASKHNVPFEFHGIADKWENIKAENLNIDKDELLIVNSLFQFNKLMDETMVEDSPRDMVLKTIRNLNPAAFVLGVVSGTYNSPFFLTRFREALFHYSALFDMIEENVTREDESRLLLERNILGKDALNVIACEGSERVERPETYKQWQARNLRAGFRQLQLDPEITEMAKQKLKAYHKEFIGDVDGRWLLEGWKGRISFALSTWESNYSS